MLVTALTIMTLIPFRIVLGTVNVGPVAQVFMPLSLWGTLISVRCKGN